MSELISELPSSPSTQPKLVSHPSSSRTRTRRDWTNLDDGPAGLIAERLLANDVADYVCFRAVCRPWRLCSTDPREHGALDRRFHPRQWIMLRGTGHRGRHCLINSSTGRSRHVDLPELDGHDVFGPTMEGLLVLLHRATWAVRLLNPLTRQAADLPPATTLPNQNPRDPKTPRKALHVSGAGLADDSTVAVDFDLYGILAVAKPGDGHWTTVVRRCPYFLQSMSFADRFYGLTHKAVMALETSASQPPRLVIAADLPTSLDRTRNYDFHLVDNGGELIFVYRGQGNNDNNEDTKYEVYRFDLDSRKMVPIHGLGGRAVFIGFEHALSVTPSVFPSVGADAIYLGFDMKTPGMQDNSPINLTDGTSQPRRSEYSIDGMPLHEPLGLDDYLSWCVTCYRHYPYSCVPCSEFAPGGIFAFA